MAVFYKHIKGMTRPGTDQKEGLWTWIQWADKTNASQEITPSSKTECAPNILVGSKNDINGRINLGHIITSDATEQVIQNPIKINNFQINESTITTEQSCNMIAPSTDMIVTDYWQVSEKNSPTNNILLQINLQDTQDKKATINLNTLLSKTLQVNDKILCNKSIHISDHIILNEKNDGEVRATYFNATSDKRAKENIIPLETNALDIIKNVQVYTFNLKSKPEERMVGVIAQEFLNKKLDDVSLVANEAATGENGDYMSIRESKLVYLLLKGMQEQQAEIEELKAQIKKLESR